MKRLLICACLALLAGITAKATLASGEYYIWLNIYEKLLGTNEAGNGPALSAYGKNTDGYVFVAESSGKSGYVLLKQKSSGKYLAASSANGWSVTLENRSTDDRFCWKADAGLYTYLINKKSGQYLGIDGAQKGNNYVSVFYNKPKGSHSQYSIIPATGSSWAEARQAYVSSVYTNAQGVKEIDYCQLNNKTVSRSDAVDIHITANDEPFLGNSKVNLGSDHTWLIIDNVVPSQVISKYLQYVTINGAAAVNGTNCRVAIYLNGAAVIPTPATVMSCQGTDGNFTLDVGNNKDLGEKSNTMKSFTLRRGYMATVASGTNGSGYSRVYVADHADLTVTLPEALNLRVSSVNIKKWQYLSKKGWGNTAGQSGGPGLRATWYWSWSADYWSTNDMEYVPCRQHRYWPSVSAVNEHASSATLSINEPDHSEQHKKSDCDCSGEWKNCTFMPDYLPSGARIGSAQPTDFTWMNTYFGHVDDMAYRCDFAVTHAYWDLGSRDETSYADWFCNTQCKSIWNNTKRPVWLTEMEVSASWNTNKIDSYEKNRKYLQVLLQKIDECAWIERYAIYGTDMWQTYMYYEANPSKGLTPAGQVYRDHRATFAYDAAYTKEPIWWRPNVKTPTLQYETSADKIIFVIGNDNGDTSEKLTIERKAKGGSWQTLATITKRSDLDPTTVRYPISPDQIDRFGDTFRVTVNTLYGGTATSNEMKMDAYVSNGTIVAESKDNVPGWTCQRSAANGYTKGDSGNTYFEVWDSKAADMAFDYYQNVGALPKGVYKLTAVCFNSSNNVEGAKVNGNMGLYAQAEGVEYFAPVTADSEIDYNKKTVIPQILVRNGVMRIGIKNQGPMTARWAGADNFVLEYLGTEDEVLDKDGDTFIWEQKQERDQQLTDLFANLSNEQKDASVLIVNADCNRNDFYGWTVDNLGTKQGDQPWDGNSSNNYWDKWNQNSLKSSMEQTITYLPAGQYEISALMRCSSGQVITFSATHQGETYTSTLTGVGDQTQGTTYKNGWNKVTLPVFTAASGDQVTIKASINASATTWWSVDHFTMTWKADDTTVGISATQNDKEKMANENAVYDLQGRQLSNGKMKKGLYIRDGKKLIRR